MNHQEAVEKAVKLLRLATSSNANEAAVAAAKAQEIIDRYKLGVLSADFDNNTSADSDKPIQDFNSDLLDPGSRLATWKVYLVQDVARANQCESYSNRHNGQWGISLVGRPGDVAAVRYLYGWLKRETEMLVVKHCRGCGVTYANNFRLGIVETIGARLKEQRKKTVEAVKTEAPAQSSMALVRVNNAIAKREQQLAEVQAWVKANLNLRNGARPMFRFDDSARTAGRLAGKQVRMKPAKATLTS